MRMVSQEQVSQRGGGCLIPGSIDGPIGQSSQQPGLVEDVPVPHHGSWTVWPLKVLPTQTILKFCVDGAEPQLCAACVLTPLEMAADSLTAHGDSISKRQDESKRLITGKWCLSSEVFKQWSISPCNIELCGFHFMETAWRFLNYSGSACIRRVGDQFW